MVQNRYCQSVLNVVHVGMKRCRVMCRKICSAKDRIGHPEAPEVCVYVWSSKTVIDGVATVKGGRIMGYGE